MTVCLTRNALASGADSATIIPARSAFAQTTETLFEPVCLKDTIARTEPCKRGLPRIAATKPCVHVAHRVGHHRHCRVACQLLQHRGCSQSARWTCGRRAGPLHRAGGHRFGQCSTKTPLASTRLIANALGQRKRRRLVSLYQGLDVKLPRRRRPTTIAARTSAASSIASVCRRAAG